MTFPWLLQRYVLREMTNTFLLASVALTGVMSLGGGVVNSMKLGDVSIGQFARLMFLVVPVAAALTLPIAALFAAASAYGRHAADNEFNACRGSGINLHILLLPSIVLGIFASLATFLLANFVIPRMVRNLNEFLGGDLTAFVTHRLNDPRGVSLGGNYRVRADEHEIDPADPERVVLHRVVIVESRDGDWTRYGTARSVELRLSAQDKLLRVSGMMRGLTLYDRRDGRFMRSEEQPIPKAELAVPIPPQLKFLTLGELLYFRARPGEWKTVRDAAVRFRWDHVRHLAADSLASSLSSGAVVLETLDGKTVTVQASAPQASPNGAVEFSAMTQKDGDGAILLEAQSGAFVLAAPEGSQGPVWELRARRYAEPERILGPYHCGARCPESLNGDVATDWVLAAPTASLPESLQRRHKEALEVLGAAIRKISGALHERLAFSAGVLVLVLLGAGLGIAYRGAHVMAAFGLSFIPLVFVILTIVTGRQMAQNEGTHVAGLACIWGGIVVTAVLDVWTLTKLVRR